MSSVFQDPTSGQWFRGPGDSPQQPDRERRLRALGIVRDPGTGNYFRLPESSRAHWMDPEPLPEPEAPQAPDPLEDSPDLGDYARTIMAGGAQVARGVGWGMRMVGLDPGGLGGAIEELGRNAVDYWNEGLSDAAKRELSKEFVRKNEAGEYEWGDASLHTVGLFGAQSLLGTAAGAGAGAGITKVLQAFANPVGRSALVKAAQAGSEQALKKLKLVDGVIGAAGFGAGEGLFAAPQAGVNVYDAVMKLPAEKLLANDRYQQILQSTDEDWPELERHQYAADTLAKEASSLAGLQAGLTSALLGAPLGAYFGRLFGKTSLANMANTSRLAGAATGAGGEAAQEFAQSGAQKLIENKARIDAGDDIDQFEGVLNEALGGALSGAPVGAALGAAERPAQAPPPAAPASPAAPGAQPQTPAPKPTIRLEPIRAAAKEAVKAGVPQDEVMKVVKAVRDGQEPVLVGVGKLKKLRMGAPAATLAPDTEVAKEPAAAAPAPAATKADTKPETSTAAPAATPAPTPVTPAAASVTRPDPVATPPAAPATEKKPEPPPARRLPKAVASGSATDAVLPTGGTLRTQYQLVDVDDLVTSHDGGGKVNERFPQELQPRDRSRSASSQWVNEAASKFVPQQMIEGVAAGGGPPIVDADGIVESGNGRTNLLRRVYELGNGEGYRTYLRANAAKFGLSPEQVDQVQKPVLVRVRQDAMSMEERIAFTQAANQTTVARLSPAEQAKTDAARVDDDMLGRFNVPEDGNVLAPTNQAFVSKFLQDLPAAERGGLLTADGAPTKQVAERIKAAVFAKAYNDDRLLALMAEDADPDVRNVVSALVAAAPAFAKAKAAGSKIDLAGPLVEGVEVLRKARRAGQAVEEYLRQQGLFSNVSPEAGRFATFLDRNIRSGGRMGKALTEVARYAEQAATAAQTQDIFGQPLPQTMDAALAAANQKLGAGEQKAAQTMLLSRAPGQTVTDQIPDAELFGGNPDLPASDPAAPDHGRPEAPASVTRNAIPSQMTQRQKAQLLAQMSESNKPIARQLLEHVMRAIEHRGYFKIDAKSEKSLLGKANRKGILRKKPWWNVEHVADSFRFKLVLDNWNDLPAAVQALSDQARGLGVSVEKADFAKFWSERGIRSRPKVGAESAGELAPVDAWGWRMLPFDLRMPNGQLAEFYITLNELDAAQEAHGHDLFEKWRFKDTQQVLAGDPAQITEFLRDLNTSRDEYDGAVRAYLTRTGQAETELLASFNRAEALASSMGAKSFVRSSIVPMPPKSLDQDPPGSRRAANPSAMTTTAPEPSRASRATGRKVLSTAITSGGSVSPTTQAVEGARLRRGDYRPFDRRLYVDGLQQKMAMVDAAIGPLIEGVKDLVDVRVVATPEDVWAHEGGLPLPSSTRGVWRVGRSYIYLVAGNLNSPEEAQKIAVHEIFGHLAIERYAEGKQAIESVQRLIGKRADWVQPHVADIRKRYGNITDLEMAREVIAHMAERGEKNAIITRLIAGMRRFLRSLGITLEYSEADIREVIARSARALMHEADKQRRLTAKLQALTPASGDQEILDALEEQVPAGVQEIDTYLDLRAQRDALVEEGGSIPDVEERLAELDAAIASLERQQDLDGPLRTPAARERAREMAMSVAAPAAPNIQAILDRIMVKPPEAYTIKDRARQVWEKIRFANTLEIKQGLIDSFASLEALERELNGGALLDAAQSAYKAALATKNLPSVMAAVMLHGVPDYVNGAYVPVAGRKGIIDIFKPLTEHPDGNLLQQWEGFAAAVRADRLIREKNPDGTNREQLMSQAEINELLALGQKYPMFSQVFAEWQTFNKQMLDLAEAAGVIDPQARAVWEKNDYVPFYRAQDVASETGTGPRNRRGVANQRADIKRLRGSDKPLGNVFENMMMNTAHLLDASFKNRAMQKVVGLGVGTAMDPVPLEWKPVEFSDEQLARALSAAGLIVGNPTTDPYGKLVVEKMTPAQKAHWSTLFTRVAPRGANIVSVMEQGKPQYYEVTDPLVLSSIVGMGHDNFDNISALFRGSKKLLTNAITADPAFMLANFVRDTLSNWVISDASTKPLVSAVSGLAATFKNDPALAQLMMAGAGGGGFYDSNPDEIRKLIATKVSHGKVPGVLTPHNLWQAWRKIGSAAENANRVAVFRAVLAAGGTVAEAAYQARDVLNFSMAGDYATMRWLTQTVPFLNARVQGLYRLYRGARDNRRAFFIKGSMLMAASLALALKNADEEEYEELPEWDKDTYWHLFVGGEHYRIPKPFEVGAMFATVPERLLRTGTGRDSGKLLLDRVAQMMLDTFAFNPVPQLVKPVIEQYSNRSMFTGSPIVGMAEQNLQPEAQFTPWTSETMRELAQALPDWAPEWLRSPRRLEAALRGYTGALGMYVLGVSDALVRGAFGYPEEPTRKIQDLPVVGRFWKDPNPRHTKYADQLYDYLNEANALYSTINRFTREQRFEEARALREANRDKLAVRVRLNRIGTNVRNLNEQIRRTQLSRSLDADAKRERIDALVDRKNVLLRQVAPYADLF